MYKDRNIQRLTTYDLRLSFGDEEQLYFNYMKFKR